MGMPAAHYVLLTKARGVQACRMHASVMMVSTAMSGERPCPSSPKIRASRRFFADVQKSPNPSSVESREQLLAEANSTQAQAADEASGAFLALCDTEDVAVSMVDFRNAPTPSFAPEVARYPAGLSDCMSGVKWLAGEAAGLGVDAGRRQRRRQSDACHGALSLLCGGEVDLIQGLYILCSEIIPQACPKISREMARSIANFCHGAARQREAG